MDPGEHRGGREDNLPHQVLPRPVSEKRFGLIEVWNFEFGFVGVQIEVSDANIKDFQDGPDMLSDFLLKCTFFTIFEKLGWDTVGKFGGALVHSHFSQDSQLQVKMGNCENYQGSNASTLSNCRLGLNLSVLKPPIQSARSSLKQVL